MADQAGLIILGNEKRNGITVKVVHEDNGDLSIYNIVQAGNGGDKLYGTPAKDEKTILQYGTQLFGEDGNDEIWGSKAADTLSGGTGDDVIYYSGGGDIIDGGDGLDTFYMNSNLFFRHYSLNGLTMTGVEEAVIYTEASVGNFDMNSVDVFRTDKSQSAQSTHLKFSAQAEVTDVVFVGKYGWRFAASKFGDVFDLSKSSVFFTIQGGLGDDVMIGGSGSNYFNGQDGDDTLIGGSADDGLTGGDGKDVLTGKDGDDFVTAGAGNDTLFGGSGDDRIYAGSGDNVVHAGEGADLISGADLQFSSGDAQPTNFDILDGGAGDDVFDDFKFDARSTSHILGGSGEDKISLGGDVSHLVVKNVEILSLSESKIIADADLLGSFEQIIGIRERQISIEFSSGGDFTWNPDWAKQGNATLIGSDDADHIDMTAARELWTINGGAGDDTIIGPSDSHFIEALDGGKGNDRLTGGKFSDYVYGGDGDDVIVASKGRDGLYGQSGQDTFVFSDDIGDSTVVNYDNSGPDRDIIDLSAAKSIKDFDDMIDHHIKMKFDGNWLTIQLDRGEIFLYGVKASDLDESAFVF
jgi:Ca2+-binding RTX toxin-like protein